MGILVELSGLGVKVHSGYLLAQWNDGKDGTNIGEITSASFTSSGDPLRLECCVSFLQSVVLRTHLEL